MAERIPKRIDHYRYTDKGILLEGVISQQESGKDLPRFMTAIVRHAGDVEYRLKFDIDAFSNRIVSGFVKTPVILQCQRCMSDLAVDLECNISLAFVHNDFEAKNAEDSDYEAFWLGQKEFLDPRALIEDELLLALPHISLHPVMKAGEPGFQTSCQIHSEYLASDTTTEKSDLYSDASVQSTYNKDSDALVNGQKDENNPFAVLKELKQLKK
ncbi:MAG: YceD family protein [Gammaproteobacteria bacterium]|nr:YceD family protein [Gammaproteobacteria bacterium]